MIRLKCGMSGYRPDKSSYQYGRGAEVVESEDIERSLVAAGQAEYINIQQVRPSATPKAVAPTIERENIVKAIIKRSRNV